MKRIYLLLTMICWALVSINAQSSSVRTCTEQEIPASQRKLFLRVAENFLEHYYNSLFLNISDEIVQESFINNNMLKGSQRYKPEFTLSVPAQSQYLMPEQYLQELSKEFKSQNFEDWSLEISGITFDTDFKATNNLDCFVTAHYTLTLNNREKTLYSRICTALCYWPQSRMYDQVRLMQVEPGKELISYTDISLINDIDYWSSIEENPSTTLPPVSDNIHNGYEFVDLGLSVKWATCNVGSENPYVSGDYYAWGETVSRYKFTKKTSFTYNNDLFVEISSDPTLDAASAIMKGKWRLPNKNEVEELISKCKWKWNHAKHGYDITGPNGNSIFMFACNTMLGKYTYTKYPTTIWTSTAADKKNAYVLEFNEIHYQTTVAERFIGANIRPVFK